MLPTQDSLVANFPTNLCDADSVILLSKKISVMEATINYSVLSATTTHTKAKTDLNFTAT